LQGVINGRDVDTVDNVCDITIVNFAIQYADVVRQAVFKIQIIIPGLFLGDIRITRLGVLIIIGSISG
jgi:hypothetical protein